MRRSVLALTGAAAVALVTLMPALASAATYQVGPSRAITQLEELEDTLQPGDVVELDGDGTYAGDVWIEAWGTADAPVTIRGIPVNGRRPVISGGDYTMIIRGGHWVIENVDVTGGAEVCLFQKAADLTVRDSIVRDCSKHGILGADLETGNLFLQRVEVTRTGFDIYKHQVYVATDEGNFPGSVFRMEGCYLHDASGGINVKSRAERVELYGNWIGGAQFHELDLVGNQEYPAELVREDSDVVGNVLVKAPGNEYTIARVGGDGTGNSQGRHRFANNTMILSDATSYGFRLGGELESFELHNNVIVGSGPTQLWREEYAGTMSVHGTSNWMSQSFVLPDGRIAGVRGTDPGFVDGPGGDYRLAPGSALLDAGTPSPAAPAGLEVPGAQGVPALLPFVPDLQDAQPRHQVGGLDIGAFELGGESPGDGSGAGGGDGSTTSGSGSGAGGSGGGATGSGGPTGGAGASDPGDGDGGLGDDDGPTGADGATDGDDDAGGAEDADDDDDAAGSDEGGDLTGSCAAGGAVAPGHAGFAVTGLLGLLLAAGRRRRTA